jgi:hypothetical protein
VSFTANVVATPGTLALTLTGFAPSIVAPQVFTPGTAALSLTTFAPEARTPILATPTAAGLSLTTFAPLVTAPRLVVPATAALVTQGFAPTVEIQDAQAIVVPPAALVLTTFEPTVTATDNVQPERPQGSVRRGRRRIKPEELPPVEFDLLLMQPSQDFSAKFEVSAEFYIGLVDQEFRGDTFAAFAVSDDIEIAVKQEWQEFAARIFGGALKAAPVRVAAVHKTARAQLELRQAGAEVEVEFS